VLAADDDEAESVEDCVRSTEGGGEEIETCEKRGERELCERTSEEGDSEEKHEEDSTDGDG